MSETDHNLKDALSLEICKRFDNQPEKLIEILHAVQDECGYVSDVALQTIAHALNITRAEVLGVVSFYHDFRRRPGAPIKLKICRAEACQAVGCQALVDHVEKHLSTKMGSASADGTIDLEFVYCLGNCALGPSVLLNDELHGRVTAERLDQLLRQRDRGAVR